MEQKFLVIGSTAAAEYCPAIWTQPKDLDIIARYDDAIKVLPTFGDMVSCMPYSDSKLVAKYSNRTPVECDIAWSGTSSEAILEYEKGNEVASPHTLLMLKMSHRYRKDSPHFWKTRDDIFLMRSVFNVGARYGELAEILALREKETYTNQLPKLNVTKENFFKGDGVNYIVDHDWIHEQVKMTERPMYQRFAVQSEQVLSSKSRFFNELSFSEQLIAVIEETIVLAFERSMLPHPGQLTYEEATKLSLSKVASSITSGWFREFAWENAHYALDSINSQKQFFTRKLKEIRNAIK
jgi:hypothetical protein